MNEKREIIKRGLKTHASELIELNRDIKLTQNYLSEFNKVIETSRKFYGLFKNLKSLTVIVKNLNSLQKRIKVLSSEIFDLSVSVGELKLQEISGTDSKFVSLIRNLKEGERLMVNKDFQTFIVNDFTKQKEFIGVFSETDNVFIIKKRQEEPKFDTKSLIHIHKKPGFEYEEPRVKKAPRKVKLSAEQKHYILLLQSFKFTGEPLETGFEKSPHGDNLKFLRLEDKNKVYFNNNGIPYLLVDSNNKIIKNLETEKVSRSAPKQINRGAEKRRKKINDLLKKAELERIKEDPEIG
jgi:hypothetical protein